ncbi:6616_t:CDS:2 [Funneliformis geosporum]|uniref:6616_t:CDS:1 n=1 Tax=Funneliformis geosporum TaxID=1117311 RepID=A0A9W4WS37_9GLOM|nr:6616_t:CDS:2 [Funneliformis geosporum]
MDSSDEECNNSSLKINVGQTFHTWEDAEKFLNEYGLEKGFSIRRRRTESQISDNGNKMIQRVGWECGNAGKNFSKTTLMISFTTVFDEHNHTMIPSPSANIAKYRKLGEDMIQFIKFCVDGITSAQNIGRLLRGKFPGRKIHQKNLYNAIQAAKKKLGTGNLIPRVVFTDFDPAMANAISLEFSDFIHCLCSKVYNPILQEINSTQQNYDRAQGLIQKSINIAIAVNSYDKFIGICHGFILDKQRNQKLKIEIEDVANIKNPIITT